MLLNTIFKTEYNWERGVSTAVLMYEVTGV